MLNLQKIILFILMVVAWTGQTHGLNPAPSHKRKYEPTYDFRNMLALMEQHRSLTREYQTNFDSFIKTKKNKELVHITLFKLTAEINRMRNHIRNVINSPYHDIPQKRLKELKHYDSFLTQAYRELNKIYQVLCEYPAVGYNKIMNPILKKAEITHLNSSKVIALLLQNELKTSS